MGHNYLDDNVAQFLAAAIQIYFFYHYYREGERFS